MKVVHIITRLILGGAQENTLLTCEDQHRDYGDDVTLITGPAIGPEGTLIPRAQSAGFKLILMNKMRRSIRPDYEWYSYRELVSLLKDIKPDVVHTHSSKAGILGRYAAAAVKIPCIHTIHGASFHYGQSKLAHFTYKTLERWAGKKTAHFISVCNAMSEQYIAAGVAPRDKFTTVYSGFSVEPFINPPRSREVVRNELGIQEGDIVVGKIGRLFHLKGHDAILAAAQNVISQAPQVRFLFVGDGLLKETFKQQIRDMKLEEHFIFTGLVPPDKIPELIHAMDFVVHTSQWEGLARVLPQALIAGKPIISYDIDGAREVCIPEVTGILVERNDIPQLVASIVRLAQSPDLRNKWGETGRLKFTDTFKHQTMTKQIREVYLKVLHR